MATTNVWYCDSGFNAGKVIGYDGYPVPDTQCKDDLESFEDAEKFVNSHPELNLALVGYSYELPNN